MPCLANGRWYSRPQHIMFTSAPPALLPQSVRRPWKESSGELFRCKCDGLWNYFASCLFVTCDSYRNQLLLLNSRPSETKRD
jgi:hypothetical protein